MLSKPQRLWVDSLRSGEYKQGHGALHIKTDKGDKFCCLGVGCDLYQEHGPGGLYTSEGTRWQGETTVKYDGQNGFPPPAVASWLGIDQKLMSELADMNDGGYNGERDMPKRKFSTIANRIEKEFSDS